MPYVVKNTFHAQTPLGAGIQTLTRGLFGGATPEEVQAKLAAAEAHQAQAEHYRAQNEKIRLEAEGLRRQAEQAKDPLASAVRTMYGDARGNEFTAYSRGGNSLAFNGENSSDAGPEPVAPTVTATPLPRPGWLTPAAEGALNDQLRSIAIALALPGKTTGSGYDDIRKVERQARIGDDVRAGLVTPTLAAQGEYASGMSRNAPFHSGADGTSMNNLTGAVDASSPLASAVISLKGAQAGKERAHGRAFDAAAGEHTAGRDLKNAQAKGFELVPVLDENGVPKIDASTGQTIMVQQAARGTAIQRGEQTRQTNDEKPEKPTAAGKAAPLRKLTKNDTDLMRKELDGLLADLDATDIDGQTRNAILAAAENGWVGSTKGHAGVIKDAIDKVAPQGFQKKPGVPGFRKQAPVGGLPAAPSAAPGGAPVRITGDADYAKLPSGAQYIAPDGSTRTKK